jgi:hypothetical protein
MSNDMVSNTGSTTHAEARSLWSGSVARQDVELEDVDECQGLVDIGACKRGIGIAKAPVELTVLLFSTTLSLDGMAMFDACEWVGLTSI